MFLTKSPRFGALLAVASLTLATSIVATSVACGDDDDGNAATGQGALGDPCTAQEDCKCQAGLLADPECKGATTVALFCVDSVCKARCTRVNDPVCRGFNDAVESAFYTCQLEVPATPTATTSGYCVSTNTPDILCDAEGKCPDGLFCNLFLNTCGTEPTGTDDDDDSTGPTGADDDDDATDTSGTTGDDDDDSTEPIECEDSPYDFAKQCDLNGVTCTNSSECPCGYSCVPSKGYCVSSHCNCPLGACEGSGKSCNFNTGFCDTATVPCTSDAQCQETRPLDRCVAGKCETPDTSCTDNAQCTAFGPTFQCVAGRCTGQGKNGDACPNGDRDCATTHRCTTGLQNVCRRVCSTNAECVDDAAGLNCKAEEALPGFPLPIGQTYCLP